ncbi:MAG: OmpH family outer membrane protein [Elusimicrobia bacterium]|jgi:Skp family chaperone for outer membrane proteins|nr:OmpH family outer membrane protein [Elusimicrobiota bacterium]
MFKRTNLFRKLTGLTVGLIAILFFTACTSIAESEDEVVIVSIDSQQVLQAHPAFKEAQEKYRAKMEEKRKEMSDMEESGQKMAQQMMQQELQQLGQQLQQEATEKMESDIQKFAKKEGYDYVLDASVILSGGKDVTEEILKTIE